VVEDKEEYIPIALENLAPGHAVPFEVFTDDGDLRKSLFDKGFLYNAFAKILIRRQGLTHFYIRTASNLHFTEYLRHAEKMNRLVKDDSVLFSEYSEYKRKHGYIDKTLLWPMARIDFELGGMRYPVFGGIPLVSGNMTPQVFDALMELNADIVVRGEDFPKYESYLHRMAESPETPLTAKQHIQVKQEILRCLFSKFLHNLEDEAIYASLLKETLDMVRLISEFAHHPDYDLKELLEIRNVDSYVSVHSVNVCIFSTVLGVRLGMDAKMLAHLAVGALLHDIGKMKISYTVITKLGDLSMDEYMLYRTHVDEGVAAARNNHNLSRHIIDIISQHHERLDGSGYPGGLQAQQISLLSQIVTVIDSYEELITSTPKRKGKTQEEVMHILRKDAEVSQKLNRTVYRALNSILNE
jgi:putative nucleotidyltransferase with HDIG domain